jgi:hypothetical protein
VGRKRCATDEQRNRSNDLDRQYYRDRQGAESVKVFIDALPADHQEIIDGKIDRLNAF